MNEFKVGDLVECIDDGGYPNLKQGLIYKIENFYGGGLLIVSNGNGLINDQFYPHRFKLAKPSLKVGDKVKSQKYGIEGVVFEIVGNAVFVECCNGICTQKLSDLEKVEEKKAPPKFTKVYVWDSVFRPDIPSIRYSFGELLDGRLKVCGENHYKGAEDRCFATYGKWEVIE